MITILMSQHIIYILSCDIFPQHPPVYFLAHKYPVVSKCLIQQAIQFL